MISASRKPPLSSAGIYRGQIEKALWIAFGVWEISALETLPGCQMDLERAVYWQYGGTFSFKATGEFLMIRLCLRSYSEEQGVGVQFIAVLRSKEGSL